jgi:hypothetical protein
MSFILIFLVFISCGDSTNEPENVTDNNNILRRDRLPTIDVYGIVYKDSHPEKDVIVKLYKGENFLDQTTTDNIGYYLINICGLRQGSGTYTVKTTKYYKGEEWCDSESFYWNEPEDEDPFEIDLYLEYCEQK